MIGKAEFKIPTDAHWYLTTGEPFHKVSYADPAKAGRLRDVTLRDARKHGAFRSVTSIQSFINKPVLNKWGKDQLLEAVRRVLPPLDDDRSDEAMELWLREIIVEAEKTRASSAHRGHEIHAATESAIKGKPYPAKWQKHVMNVATKLRESEGIDIFAPGVISEMSFYNNLGYGGTIDAYMPVDFRWMIDFKTREEILTVDGKPAEKLAHPEKAMQLSAYRMGIGDNICKCLNVFVDEKANVLIHEWTDEELNHQWLRFLALLRFVQLTDKHYPEEKGFGFTTWTSMT